MKSNLRSSSPFFLLTVLLLQPTPDGVHVRALATDRQAGAAARESFALTLADGIAPAWGDNRCPICSACGVEGQRLSPAAARSRFEWQRPKGRAAGGRV